LWEQVAPIPAFAGRRSGGCEVIDDVIGLFGGEVDGEVDTNEVVVLDVNGASSSFFADFTPRRNISTVQHDGKLWLVGGARGDDRLSDVWSAIPYGEFELVTSETAIGSVESCMLLSFGGNLFLLGGETDEEDDYSRKVWSSADGIAWNQTHEFSEGQIRSASVLNSSLYALVQTGESDAFLYNQVWRSSNGSDWENIALAPWNFSPGNFQMPVFSGKMWVLGGVTEEGDSETHHREVWSSSDGVTWSLATAEAAWPGRTEGFIAVLNGKLWLIGGETESGLVGDIWRTPVD
jgi:hypothetical protein